MNQKPIPWTLVYHNAPKGLSSLYGTQRVFVSPDAKTIEIQTNHKGFNTEFPYDWRAWIIRVQFTEDLGWHIKKDSYAENAKHIYSELWDKNLNDILDIEIEKINYHITTYAIIKKEQYFMNLETTKC